MLLRQHTSKRWFVILRLLTNVSTLPGEKWTPKIGSLQSCCIPKTTLLWLAISSIHNPADLLTTVHLPPHWHQTVITSNVFYYFVLFHFPTQPLPKIPTFFQKSNYFPEAFFCNKATFELRTRTAVANNVVTSKQTAAKYTIMLLLVIQIHNTDINNNN